MIHDPKDPLDHWSRGIMDFQDYLSTPVFCVTLTPEVFTSPFTFPPVWFGGRKISSTHTGYSRVLSLYSPFLLHLWLFVPLFLILSVSLPPPLCNDSYSVFLFCS